MIPVFNVVLISDKDENATDNGKHVVLFHLSKYSDKLYGNVQMSNFSQVPALLVFVAISEFWFSGLSKLIIYKLIKATTAFLIAFLIKINNKKLDQITFNKYFTCSLILFCTCGTFLNIPRGYWHYSWQ